MQYVLLTAKISAAGNASLICAFLSNGIVSRIGTRYTFLLVRVPNGNHSFSIFFLTKKNTILPSTVLLLISATYNGTVSEGNEVIKYHISESSISNEALVTQNVLQLFILNQLTLGNVVFLLET